MRAHFHFDDGVTFGLQYLADAIAAKNEYGVQVGMYIGLRFGYTQDHVPLLFRLMKETWHKAHEDVVTAVDHHLKLRTPEACDFFYESVFFLTDYFAEDEFRALARKAMFGLGNINSELSIQRIREIAVSEEKVLRDLAFEQIELHRIPGISRVPGDEILWHELD